MARQPIAGRGARRHRMRLVARRVLLTVMTGVGITACGARTPVALRVSSLVAPAPLTGVFAGVVSLDGEILSLQLDTAEVRFAGLAPGDATVLEAVTVRAVVATDSAGVGIPVGASGAAPVAEALQPGERRALGRQRFDLPLPPGARLRDLWVAFQLRGTAQPTGHSAELVIGYACSETNVLGGTKASAARSRRMSASYVAGCRL